LKIKASQSGTSVSFIQKENVITNLNGSSISPNWSVGSRKSTGGSSITITSFPANTNPSSLVVLQFGSFPTFPKPVASFEYPS